MWVGTAENGLKRVDLKNNKFKSFEVDEKDNNKLQSLCNAIPAAHVSPLCHGRKR